MNTLAPAPIKGGLSHILICSAKINFARSPQAHLPQIPVERVLLVGSVLLQMSCNNWMRTLFP